MGGKSSKSKQKVTIPPEVLARYNLVNEQAQALSGTPFKQYSTDPNDFAAQMTDTQRRAMGMTEDMYGNTNDMVARGTAGVDQLSAEDINQYMSPYLQDVVDQTMKRLDYTQGQQRSNQSGQAVMNGAYGGDRGGIAAANLAYTQDMTRGSTLADLLNTGYNQAVSTATGQQNVQAANLNRLLQGAGVEGQTGLAAANQLFNQGSTEQQTNQAGMSGLYNQFQQQQSYPFQVVDFLARVAEGTGALSGSTTSTTTPGGFFSDRRLKTDIKRVGYTDDGMPIYKYKYKGDPEEKTQIGFMADEVEKKHPEAVGVAAGFKTVDYDKATPKSLGGSMGGGVGMADARQGFADGGMGMYGSALNIPTDSGPQRQLMVAGDLPAQESGLTKAADAASSIASLASTGKDVYDFGKKGYDWLNTDSEKDMAYGLAGVGAYRGGRINKAAGGPLPYETGDKKTGLDIPTEPTTHNELIKPSSAPAKGASPFEDIMSLVKTAASVVPLFLADGGAANSPDVLENDPEAVGLGPVVKAPVAVAAAKPAMEPTFDNILHASRHAIGSIESSNDYSIVGPATKYKSGVVDRPYGKYQVMGANIPSWTKEVLGREMTPQEFLSNGKAQDAVFNGKFGQALKKTGNPMDAASIWFTGQPTSKVSAGAKDSLGTTVPVYLSKFAKASGMPLPGGVAGGFTEPLSNTGLAGANILPTSDEGMTLNPTSAFGKVKDFVSEVLPSSPEAKLALLAGVFGMLASPNHYLLQAIGSGGLAGVQTYGDLMKLKNESMRVNNEAMRNTMGVIQNRFSTVDGVHYLDRYTGQMMGRDEYSSIVNKMLSSSGIGGGGPATGVAPAAANGASTTADPVGKILETMPPIPETAPATGEGDTPAVGTAKEVLSGASSPTPMDVPPPSDGSIPTGADGAPATTAAVPPKDSLTIRSSILRDPNRWRDVPDNLNAPKLYAMADEAKRSALEFRQKGQDAAPYSEAYSKNMYEQANAQMALYTKYQEQATAALNAASEQGVSRLNKGVESEYKFVTVQPKAGGPKVQMRESDAIAAANRGEVVISEQSPTETNLKEVPDPTNPTGPKVFRTEAQILSDAAAGKSTISEYNPAETETVAVLKDATNPNSDTEIITKKEALDRRSKGIPVVTAVSPTKTEIVNIPSDPDDPTSSSVAVTKADLINANAGGDPTVVGFPPSRTSLRTVQKGPNDPQVLVTDADAISASGAGKPIVSAPSPMAVERAKKAQETDVAMSDDAITRQPLITRVGTLAKIMENYETGAWDEQKAAIFGQLRAAGFDVPQDSTASVQEIIKDSTKQVYDQAKLIGNKVLVAEIQGLSKTVPGVGLTPNANRELLSKMKGLLDWDQQMYEDYMDYRKLNPNDFNTEQWKAAWMKDPRHQQDKFIHNASLDIAPKGMSIPPKDQLEDGQKVNLRNHGIMYWDAEKGKFVDERPVRGGGLINGRN